MPINSRDKGKRGELETVALAKAAGFTEARRSQQYCGTSDSADVVGVPGLHLEAKWVERGALYDWRDQSVRDAGASGNLPVVIHKRNRREPVAILSAATFLKVWFEYLQMKAMMCIPDGEEY